MVAAHDRLRQQRKELGLTLGDAARLLGCSVVDYSATERAAAGGGAPWIAETMRRALLFSTIEAAPSELRVRCPHAQEGPCAGDCCWCFGTQFITQSRLEAARADFAGYVREWNDIPF